jgi:glucokinase
MRLVADIGGTNARLALARDGTLLSGSARSFRNTEHPGFAELADEYLRQAGADPLDSIVVAVAGPVGAGVARLTNHDWSFDAAALSARFGAASTVLLNDLSALGHALPALSGDDLGPVIPGAEDAPREGQSLVAGIGTGFNVCSVLLTGQSTICLKSEYGHVSLPGAVGDALEARIGSKIDRFATVEDCFSGAGVSAVFAALTGRAGVSPVAALAGDDPVSAEFRDFYATLVGYLARDLRLAFMPEAGIKFAGSVARAVLSGPSRPQFAAVYGADTPVDLPAMAGVDLILDDMAALKGCARYA